MKNDWIEWGGGECPVSGDTLVEVKFRFGEDSEFILPALEWDWEHSDDDYDIVKYRVVKNV